MNISAFPVYSTNIFPLANDTKQGGQLLTEYNLRSRESVGTSESVNYFIGPSYCHSKSDFQVTKQTDGAGGTVSSSTLEISSGRAIINGHYLETLAPVTIDLLELNKQAKLEGTDPLTGRLVVGLRAMYSTLPTMAGSMMVENEDEMYEGIQIVILPPDKFKLPTDVPNEEDKITAHIKLATFNFSNGSINSLVDNYPERIQYISSSRLSGVENLVSDEYVTKTGLNPKKLYVFSGKGSTEDKLDTWCEAQDSLIVWDNNPVLTTDKPKNPSALFTTDANGKVILKLPHKQVDGMKDTDGNPQYFREKDLSLPIANFSAGTSGTVSKEYTNKVKSVLSQIQNIYRMPGGKQVGFIDDLTNETVGESPYNSLPVINPSWNIGDYVLVRQDGTITGVAIDGITNPSTMYVVLPGLIKKYRFHSKVENSNTPPTDLTGMQIDIEYLSQGSEVNTDDPDVYSSYFILDAARGVIDKDYFVLKLWTSDDETTFENYYFVVSDTGDREYSNPVWITGQMQYATEEKVGGFLNVPENQLDAGYVYLDDTGHLVLLDYGLLRSGTLAYQLGESVTIPAGITGEEIQSNLGEYVNNRVAFANSQYKLSATDSKVIDITFTLSPEEEVSTINIFEIDSRFNTSVYLHILGESNENCTINIADCEKIRLDISCTGNPTINLSRSCLYYDTNVLNQLSNISEMSLWYQRYESTDPNLLIDGMTVIECDAPIIPDDIDYWSEATPNDNHFMFALQSITFGPDGSIIGCGLYVKNETSANIEEGSSIITSRFVLPQGAGLSYPIKRLTHRLKVSGCFVTAYTVDSPKGYMIIDSNFSALTDIYDPYSSYNHLEGNVNFYVQAHIVDNVTGLLLGTALDAWESNAFHCFKGVVL